MDDGEEGASASPQNPAHMLLTAAAVLALCCAGVVLVAKTAQVTMAALGLEVWGLLLWFGIAEWPMDELAPRRVARERA